GALLATFTVTPVLARLLLPQHIQEVETVFVRALRASYTPVLRWALGRLKWAVIMGVAVSRPEFSCRLPARQRIPSRTGGGQFLDQSIDAADDVARRRHRADPQDARDSV